MTQRTPGRRWFALSALLTAVACGHIGIELNDVDVGIGGGNGDTGSGGGDGSESGGGPMVGGQGASIDMGGASSGGECTPDCVCEQAGTDEICALTCLESPCSTRCERSCTVDSGEASDLDIECQIGAKCESINTESDNSLEVTCSGRGTCDVSCGDAKSCRTQCLGLGNCLVSCDAAEDCRLDCGVGLACGIRDGRLEDLECVGIGPHRCDNGAVVCSLLDCILF